MSMTRPPVRPTARPTGWLRRSLARALAVGAAALLVTGAVAACTSDSGSDPSDEVTGATTGVQTALVEVHAAPGCGCCAGWAEYMESHGFAVESTEDPNLTDFKAARGIPAEAQSCHTSVIDGYTVEGHVPIEAIRDLLADRPDIDGIALPGMPSGSPGMPGEKLAPFEVLALDEGATSLFGEY